MMVLGAAWSGRLPVTQKIQTGSTPVSTANDTYKTILD